MTELEIPADTDRTERKALVTEFADIGDVVEVYDPVMLEGEADRLTGEIVAFEEDLLVLDAGDASTERIEYGDLERLSTVERDGE